MRRFFTLSAPSCSGNATWLEIVDLFMSSSKRLLHSSLAAGGAFLLFLGARSLSTQDRNGYIEAAMGLLLVASAVFRYLKENKKEKNIFKVLTSEEE